jgi:hypothetical protein
MSFNSIQFLIFFPIVTILYFALPFRLRWAMLLVASSIFYMAFIPIYILILSGQQPTGCKLHRSSLIRRRQAFSYQSVA